MTETPNFDHNSLEWCTDCTSDLCWDCAQQALYKSEEGTKLRANPPRFEMFWWEDLGRFRKYMGDDVNPAVHGLHQARHVAKPMIEHQNAQDYELHGGDYASASGYRPFSKEEANLLCLAHVTHDWHEAIVGDVPEPEKNYNLYVSELEINQQVLASVLHLHPDHHLLRHMREIMGDFEGKTFLGRAFSAGEYAGYFLTGLRAYSLLSHEDLDDAEKHQSYLMAHAVVNRCTPILEKASKEFLFCKFLLNSNKDVIKTLIEKD